jgi:hypothetical protein
MQNDFDLNEKFRATYENLSNKGLKNDANDEQILFYSCFGPKHLQNNENDSTDEDKNLNNSETDLVSFGDLRRLFFLNFIGKLFKTK